MKTAKEAWELQRIGFNCLHLTDQEMADMKAAFYSGYSAALVAIGDMRIISEQIDELRNEVALWFESAPDAPKW